MNRVKDLSEWRSEEIVKVQLLKSAHNLKIEDYPTPLLDFFITAKDNPKVKFAVEVKSDKSFEKNIKKQLNHLKSYYESRIIDFPIILFKIDDKKETGKIDFLIEPGNEALNIKESFNFVRLDIENLNTLIENIYRWYTKKE